MPKTFEGTMKMSSSRASKRTPTWQLYGSSKIPFWPALSRPDPEAGQKGILELPYSYIKRGLISKLWMSPFSWHPQNSWAFFYNPNKAIWTLCFTLKSQQIIKEFQGGRKCTIRSDLHASGSRPAPQDANEDLRLSNALYHLLWESQITIFPKKSPGREYI